MYVDFRIDKSGDIIFKEQHKDNCSLKISFYLSKTKAQKVVFDLSDFEKAKPSKYALKVSFDINKSLANKSVNIINDENALNQLLTLKLKTTLGELPLRKNFGSKISLMRHKEINAGNLSQLEAYVRECLSDIIPNPIVEAKPYINYDNGYNQTVILTVYNGNKKILNYILER